jgi:hypothetical protein
MAIYLGDSGYVELKREGLNTKLVSTLDPDDVNVARKRFSFDFEVDSIITGDQLEIYTEDGSTLELVDGHVYPDGRWYCNVDQAGGVRLYNDFASALNGEEADALPLVVPSRSIPIYAVTRNSLYRCIAQVSDYSMTTARETVDLTSLGEEFRTNFSSGLISGQGQLNCLWDYEASTCNNTEGDTGAERSHYLAQLVMRTQQGASFDGRFFLKAPGRAAIDGGNSYGIDDAIWWEAKCVITNVAMAFSASEPVRSTVDFVTSGPIRLRTGAVPRYLLQEDSSAVLLETGDYHLELESD